MTKRVRSSKISRRTLLERFGLGVAALSTGACKPIAESTPYSGRKGGPEGPWGGVGEFDRALFPLHVQSGAPTEQSILCWTRYTGDEALELHTARWDGESWKSLPSKSVSPNKLGFVHHNLSGMNDDESIAYQFVDASGRGSTIGYSRTAISSESSAIVRFGATSCTSQRRLDFPSLENLAQGFEMDFFLWLGDTVYADDAETREEYDACYAFNLGTNGFQAIVNKVPGIFTWDDHEIANNWNTEPISAERFETAVSSYFDNLPIAPLPDKPHQLWRSYRFGKTLEVFVLDCRGERAHERGEYISLEQMAWLKEGLSNSTATWKIIQNSVPITQMPPVYQLPSMIEDRWEGFQAQRDELLDHITDHQIGGVLFVSGDLHQSSLSRLEATGSRSRIFELCAGPSGPNFLGTPARFFEDGEQWPWSDAQNCATWFACHASGICRIVSIDEYNDTLFDGIIDHHGNLLSAEIMHPWETDE